jgi:hypothetical protein
MDEFSYSRNCRTVRKTVRGPCVLPQQILCRTDGSFDYAISVHIGRTHAGRWRSSCDNTKSSTHSTSTCTHARSV